MNSDPSEATPTDRRGHRQLLLRGGLVADGVGTRTRRADILIDGPLIRWIGLGDPGVGDHDTLTLNPGTVLCPGFIDAHIHAETCLLTDGRVDAALSQGVTTLVVGQDGMSWIGAERRTIDYLNRYFAAVNGPIPSDHAMSVAEFARHVSDRLSQNVAVLASHGTIRYNVGGVDPGRLSRRQQAAARSQVENCLADGAVGMSSGFDYLPSAYGDVDEMTDLAHPLSEAGRPYVSHMRGNGPGARAGLTELIRVGRNAAVRVHASHLWGSPDDIVAAYQAADEGGVYLSHDMYPYRRSSTALAALLLPKPFQAGGPDATVARLREPALRAELRSAPTMRTEVLDSVVLGYVPPAYADDVGLSITAAAARCRRAPQDWVMDLIVDANMVVGGHRERPALTDEHLRWIVDHERYAAGSDGIFLGQLPHPRGSGTFPRLARHYLSQGPERGYQLLARHAAANPAATYGLGRRGRLVPGLAADIVVIGPGGLHERATYGHPDRPADGVDLVLVNGTVVWRSGKVLEGRHPGSVISN
ncbi:N-acyl-D-amino-acid deacylase [Micromonospora sp. Llam0]|uniref:N-acyl-D-amino-acid deacylase family protein n=1 Tax=Micromonospora sp. Llam0 TaxID=2485143 RepID=UPI000F475D91|nr:amidohydrolase family protein [Micromonospora sp. Llam0]ROO52673.1 N-acyl-D-amino-acid deacylase [Micromonospora sp. Llam0]